MKDESSLISFIFIPPSFPRSRILDGRLVIEVHHGGYTHIRLNKNVPPRMKTRRMYSHIHKASLAMIMIIVPRYLCDVGELRDLTRRIVIMDEIYHLRSLSSLSSTSLFSQLFLPSFLFLFLHSACRYAHCVTRLRTMPRSLAAFSFSSPSFIRRMRDANGRLSRIPRHPQSRFARNYLP